MLLAHTQECKTKKEAKPASPSPPPPGSSCRECRSPGCSIGGGDSRCRVAACLWGLFFHFLGEGERLFFFSFLFYFCMFFVICVFGTLWTRHDCGFPGLPGDPLHWNRRGQLCQAGLRREGGHPTAMEGDRPGQHEGKYPPGRGRGALTPGPAQDHTLCLSPR